ncbi:hypothetical protein AMS68_006998 [Peltaster fructicola]|uniref:CTLH domain-containing protein n=1 Tax=Peltaster fructicola TaxID=286661 RepID=A0A6H0Y3I9_9PEZI|nr:hypothetical protein AMS68_006998 [Peltaster fructicola]
MRVCRRQLVYGHHTAIALQVRALENLMIVSSTPLPPVNTAGPTVRSTSSQPSPAQESTAQPRTLHQHNETQPLTTHLADSPARSPLKRRRLSTADDSSPNSANRQLRKRHKGTKDATTQREMRLGSSHEHRGRYSTNGSSQNGSSPHTNGTTNGYHNDADEEHEMSPSGSFHGHNREEVTRIILQSLSDLGYREAANQLSKESGYQLEVPSVAAFRAAVLQGEWQEAEMLLFGFEHTASSAQENGQAWQKSRTTRNSYDKSGLPLAEGADTVALRFLLRQQKYLELLEARNLSAALHVLRNELAPLKQDTAKLHALSSFMMCSSKLDLYARALWDGAHGDSRTELLTNISKSISPSVMIPEHRLATLLNTVQTDQINRCTYHNTLTRPSLYHDHECSVEDVPMSFFHELRTHTDEVWTLEFSHNGTMLAAAGREGLVTVHDTTRWKVLYELRDYERSSVAIENRGVCQIAFSPDDRYLIACSYNSEFSVISMRDGRVVARGDHFDYPVCAVAWLPDSETFVIGSQSSARPLNMYSMRQNGNTSSLGVIKNNEIHSWRDPPWDPKLKDHNPTSFRIVAVAVSRDGSLMAASTMDNRLMTFDLLTRQRVSDWQMDGQVTSIAFSSDGSQMLINMSVSRCQTIDSYTGKLVTDFEGIRQRGLILKSCFGGAGETFVISGSEDGTIHVWRRHSGERIGNIYAHGQHSVNAVAWHPTNSAIFASAGDDRRVNGHLTMLCELRVRVIRLPNQLEALLIHDPDTDKASAAMDVNVGSFSDSDELPGLAHAVEHLLFMGTEKYPGENDYNQYLTKFGGSSNAFTAATSTNYYFELSASSTSNSPTASASSSTTSLAVPKTRAPLYGALDRFSQFFVKPLFLADTLDRELRAVDSENKKNLQSDQWRLYQLEKSTSNKLHPFQKFSTGSYKTLHDDPIGRGVKIRDAFMDFYKKHYSANRMKLVVLGQEDLNTLQAWVEEFFSDVENQDLPQLRWDDVPSLTTEQLGMQIFAKPVMDQKILEIIFPYPDQDDLWESSPGRYISHLVGHEGPGSILAYLKAKGWANSLSAGASSICPGTALFQVSLRLTEAGLKNYLELVKIVFQYIELLKAQPPQQWIVDEMAKLAEVEFKFRQKIPASRTASQIAGVMQKPYPRDQLMSAQYLIREFNPEAIQRGLDALRPDNFRVLLVSQEYPGDWPEREKWYNTEYKIERLPAELLQELKDGAKSGSPRPAELFLPGKNEFVPSRLDVEKKENEEPLVTPKLIKNDENIRTWFKKDDRFWVPKANIDVCLRSPIVNASPLTVVMTSLYKELVQDSLSEYAYDAELAGLQYNVASHSQGLDISLSGYNDKMSVLLEKVLTTMRDLEVSNERFEIIKERLLRSFRNYEYQDPFRVISSFSRWLVSERDWAVHELLEELPSVTADDLRSFFPQILKQMHIELLIHGNLYKRDALDITDMVEKTLQAHRLPPSQWPTKRNIVIPPGSSYVYSRTLKNADNVNHCIEYILVIGQNISRSLRARLLLFAQMIDEPCFDQLRTKEQLGYVVGSGVVILNNVSAFRVLIQSEKDCRFLETRIDSFFTGFEKVLRDMSQEDFNAHKTGVINKRLEKLKNLSQESARLWHHITSEAFDFELVYRDAENVEQLNKDDILNFYQQYIHPSSSTRAKAAVHLVAQASTADIAAKLDPQEQAQKLTATLGEALGQMGLPVDTAALSERLGKVDVHAGDVDDIVKALTGYIGETAQLAEAQLAQIAEQGKLLLTQILPSLGIQAAKDEHATDTVAVESTPAVAIEDVKAWKATMPVSAGATPVKHLSEFEELESKL